MSMGDGPTTRPSLLLRIRDTQDRTAWAEFVELYAPLLHAYGLHRGLQDADSADLAQEVLRRMVTASSRFRYDSSRGSFRGWLLAIARNELTRFVKRRKRQSLGSGDTEVGQLLQEQPDHREERAFWDREYAWNLLHWAARRVQPEFRETTWQAFWSTTVDGKSPQTVAAELGISLGAVYIARSRVSARIREVVATVEGD